MCFPGSHLASSGDVLCVCSIPASEEAGRNSSTKGKLKVALLISQNCKEKVCSVLFHV